MTDDGQLEKVAELFKALGTVSRLRILTSLASGEGSVGSLVDATGLSQPLVSQHLRLLRSMNLVTVSRSGREAIYALTDEHVAHVIDDAIAHTVEASPMTDHSHYIRGQNRTEETRMTTEIKAEHTLDEHKHGTADCTHETVQHGDHTDFLHDGHRHAEHDDHYDEHDEPAEHSVSDHTHGAAECTHETVEHGDHTDYVHDGHRHAEHGDHYDEH